MDILRICLFGNPRISRTNWKTEEKLTRSVQTLLSFILINRHRLYSREVLAGIFWGEYPEKHARNCLRTTLWRLRKILEPAGIPKGTFLISGILGEIGFNNTSDFWLDIDNFEGTANRYLSRPVQFIKQNDTDEFENILSIYTGDLLEGFFDDWIIKERERLQSLYLKCLMHLMELYNHHGDYDKSLAYGAQLLNFDPLMEDVHRKMMCIYMSRGQRSSAIQQFKSCCQILEKELKILPMEETVVLYRKICNGNISI